MELPEEKDPVIVMGACWNLIKFEVAGPQERKSRKHKNSTKNKEASMRLEMKYSTIVPKLLTWNEANFSPKVEKQVLSLRNDLQNMKSSLKNCEGKQDQIRDIFHEVEDIVDTYVVDVAKERRRNKALNLFRGFNRPTMFHNVAERIMQLRTKIEEINEINDKYPMEHEDVKGADQNLQRYDLLQKRRMQVEEEDVVGFIEEAETLVNQLVRGTEELDVISISGMGGLGKTTLAKKVYKHPSVKKHFSCNAWVSVYQNFKMKDLLLAILREVAQMTDKTLEMKVMEMPNEISELEVTQMTEEEQLKQELDKRLSHHKYLVVLDDIWSSQHWDELKLFFPNYKNGSRVLVTTRLKQVAHLVSGNPPLELRFLGGNESWDLFTRKVFRKEPCPTDLEHFGKKIMAKCGGLPLAIVVFGDLLACREKTYDIWKFMAANGNWLVAQETLFLDTLGLSYHDLPPYLQPCFLYLGLFPKGYKIPARQLIQLWISEGFIEHEDSETTREEDVAEKYLQHLVDRSLIEVEERRSDGGVKTCRVHDLTRDLCLQLSRDEKFLESHSCVPSEHTEPRRLSIHCSRRDYISGAEPSNTRFVRTLLCFNDDNQKLFIEDWKSLFKSFKLLRVLDLGEREVHSLPKAIGKLILLKYLRVKTVDCVGVPSSIFSLHYLQTLDLRRCQVHVLPEEIWSMQELRHLYLDGCSRLPENAGKKFLSNLQTLCCISKDPTDGVRIAENAPNLRKLGLYDYQCNSSNEQDFTFNLPCLKYLKFESECTFKEPIELPQTITKITIKRASLQHKTIKMFQNIFKLQILKFDGASFSDNQLVFEKGWFPELQLLKIENSKIEKWKLGQGAVPKLKRVVISKCPDLTSLPKELWDMTTLQELELLWLPEHLTKEIGEFKKSELKVVIGPPVRLHDGASSSQMV